jgi:hypothetical protein
MSFLGSELHTLQWTSFRRPQRSLWLAASAVQSLSVAEFALAWLILFECAKNES